MVETHCQPDEEFESTCTLPNNTLAVNGGPSMRCYDLDLPLSLPHPIVHLFFCHFSEHTLCQQQQLALCTCTRRLTGMYMHASDCAAHMNEHTFCTRVWLQPPGNAAPWNKPAEPSEWNGVRLAFSNGLNLPIIPKTCLPLHTTALHPNHSKFQHLMTYVITCVCMSCIWSVSLCMFSSLCERVLVWFVRSRRPYSHYLSCSQVLQLNVVCLHR